MVVPNNVGRVVIAQLLDPDKDNKTKLFELVVWMGSGELKTDTSAEGSVLIILRSQYFLYTVHSVDEKVKSTPHKLRKFKL